MHLLIIVILICFLFPFIGRLVIGLFRGVFWLLLILAGLAVIGALTHGWSDISADHQRRINIRGISMSEEAKTLETDSDEYQWTVEFRVRPPDERQIRMMNSVGPMMFYNIAGLWLSVLAPDARIIERDGMAIRRIAFPTRSLARKFIATWSGRLKQTG